MTGDRAKWLTLACAIVAWLFVAMACVGCGETYWMPMVYDRPRPVQHVDDAIADAERGVILETR